MKKTSYNGSGTIITFELGSPIQVDGAVFIQEITTPTPVAGYGSVYTKSSNELYFQDGAGVEHLVHGDAFSTMCFHSPTPSSVSISASATFTKITSFENVRSEDDLGNMSSNASTNNQTVGANGGGSYGILFNASITVAGGAAKEVIINVGIELNTKIDVTGATNATPIVVTSVAHGLLNGDMITISGGTTNTAVNGDWVVTAKTADTFTLIDLTGTDSVGNGVYDASSGDVDIIYPGNLNIHREVSASDIGTGGGGSDYVLVTGDKVSLYVVNLDDTNNISIFSVNLSSRRIGD